MSDAELSKKSIADLRYIAKMLGIKSPTTLKKTELIEKIIAVGDTRAPQAPEQAPAEKPSEEKTPKEKVKKSPRGRRPSKAKPGEKQEKKEDAVSETPQKKTRGRPPKKKDTPPKDEIQNEEETVSSDTASVEAPTEAEAVEPFESGDKQKKNKYTEDNEVEGVLDIVSDNYGFLRVENYVASNKDIYVPMVQIKRFNLKTGDKVRGKCRFQKDTEKYQALYYVTGVNDGPPDSARRRKSFETLTPIFPDERLKLERDPKEFSTRLIDLMAPIGKGQRGMIVSPPKAGKTVLLKQIAHSITANYPDIHLMVLLIDERPEEVTDMRESVDGDVISSTFDELPERHVKVAEMVLERAQRLVEAGKDVVILMDSLTRLARAYNLTIPPTGRTLSGGIDPGALHKPKKFFGAARNIRGGGSLTIVATALVDTGSKMDDVIFEEFKGTGNMELHLDRKLSEKRIFPAIDVNKSGTRREDLLLTEKELSSVFTIRKAMSNIGTADVTEMLINQMQRCETNDKFVESVKMSFKD